ITPTPTTTTTTTTTTTPTTTTAPSPSPGAVGHTIYGCGVEVEAGRLAQHRSECAHRPAVCEWCAATVSATHRQSHESACAGEKVPCAQCASSVPRRRLAAHMEGECLVPCRLGCGVRVLFQRLSDHAAEECDRRQV